MEYRFPIVIGKDFAGTIEGLGPDVTGFSPGDEVFGVLMKPALGDGTFGEFVAAPVAYMAKIPAGLDHLRAGALGLAGVAALNAVDAVDPKAGETVLVSGATGGVGSFAVQLAAARGAHVIATARPGDEEDFARRLGAAETVDHTEDVTEAVIAIRPNGVHAVVHLAGDGLQLAEALVPGGRFASTVGLGAIQLEGRDVQAQAIMAVPTTVALDWLAAEVVAGRLTVPIQRTYPLQDVPRALQDFAKPKLGKLAIAID
jgi:NADPH:quinone reductase-like Zn-dependent oxidoreductase